MRKNIIAAALLAPALAFAPAAAMAHYCKGYHHHHHHAKAGKGAYGSSKSMKDTTGTRNDAGSQNLDKNTDVNKDTNRNNPSSGTTY